MSKLPVSWSAIPLGQEIEFKKGQKPKFLYEMSNEGLVPYIDIKAFEKGNIRRYADCNSGVIAEANDTLMVWDGARSGLVGNGIAGVIGSTLMRIRPMSSNRNYLHQFLKFKFSQINSNTKGTGIPHVSPEFLFDIDIPLAPLPEQRRIADKLDAVLARVDDCRDRLDRIPAILKRFRQSVVSAATDGLLTSDWRVRNYGSTDRNITTTTLVEQCLQGRVITYGVIKLGDETPQGVPCLRTSNVRWLRIDTEGIKKIAQALSNEYPRTILQGDEVLVNVRGTLGGVAVATTDMIGWNVSREVAVVPVDQSQVNPQFLALWIGAERSQGWLRGVEKGVAYTGINIEDLRTLPLEFPKLEEQTEIVRRVEGLFASADRLETRYTAARAHVEKLTPATLAKAFRGELVPQDPNDEPASELLERIRAQHGEQVSKNPKRSRKVTA